MLTLASCNTANDGEVVKKSENIETISTTSNGPKKTKDISETKLYDEIVMDAISKRKGADIITQEFKLVVSALNRFLRSIKHDAHPEKRLKIKKVLKAHGAVLLSGLVQTAFYMIAAGEDKIAIETALDKLILQFFEVK